MYLRIRNLREDKDMNQTQMAKVLNMSQTGYSKYETGENDIPTSVLISLAEFHKTNVDYILGLTDNSVYYKKYDILVMSYYNLFQAKNQYPETDYFIINQG